jgi:hypothetical protein
LTFENALAVDLHCTLHQSFLVDGELLAYLWDVWEAAQ